MAVYLGSNEVNLRGGQPIENGLPSGGLTGQVLAKSSNDDYVAAWTTVYDVPAGGSAGQILTKNSSTNYDYSWADASSDAGNFLITVTNHTSSDKTYDEIKAAYDGGQTLVVFNSYDGEKEYMSLSRFYASKFYFESIYQNAKTSNIHTIYSHRLIIEKTSGGTTIGTWQESIIGGIPSGGSDGYFLKKYGNNDYSLTWGSGPRPVPAPLSGGTGYILTQTSNTTCAWQAPQGKLPAGGSSGQILTKNGSSDYNAVWVTPANVLPTGGAAGQVLKKNSSTNYDVTWADASGGGGDGLLVTFEYDATQNSITCDTNLSDIWGAVADGDPIRGILKRITDGYDCEWIPLRFKGEEFNPVYFQCITPVSENGSVLLISIYCNGPEPLYYEHCKELFYEGYFYTSQNTYVLSTDVAEWGPLYNVFHESDRICTIKAVVTIDNVPIQFEGTSREYYYDGDADSHYFITHFCATRVINNNGTYELHTYSFDAKQSEEDTTRTTAENYAHKKVVLSAV